MPIVVLLVVAVLGPEPSAVHAQAVGSVAGSIEAIQQWLYEPTRLNGVALPATNVTYLFSYGS